jgi:hypothetical protein
VNLLAARVVLRPRVLGDVLDLAVPFVLGGRRPLSRLALGSLLPALGLCLFLRLSLGWNWYAVWLVAIVLGDVLEGLFTAAYGELLFQPPEAVRPGGIWRRFGARLGSYLGTLLVARLLLAATLLFVPLTPFAAVYLLFVREAGLLEGASVFGAIGRAYRFVQRQVGSCLGLLVALCLAPVLFVLSAELLGDALVSDVLQLGSPFGQLFTDGGSGYALVGFFLSVPVTAGARFLKYIDVRTRKEGWDIQLRFTAIAAADEDRRQGSTAA